MLIPRELQAMAARASAGLVEGRGAAAAALRPAAEGRATATQSHERCWAPALSRPPVGGGTRGETQPVRKTTTHGTSG